MRLCFSPRCHSTDTVSAHVLTQTPRPVSLTFAETVDPAILPDIRPPSRGSNSLRRTSSSSSSLGDGTRRGSALMTRTPSDRRRSMSEQGIISVTALAGRRSSTASRSSPSPTAGSRVAASVSPRRASLSMFDERTSSVTDGRPQSRQSLTGDRPPSRRSVSGDRPTSRMSQRSNSSSSMGDW